MRPSLSNLGIQYTANRITSQGGERLTKFVPLEKQSKKARRAHYLQQRKGWGCLSPVTRQEKNPHAYQRSRQKQQDRKAALQSAAEHTG